MAKYENIDAIPCDFLAEAADDALEKTIEMMGYDGPEAYAKGSAECTKPCLLADLGCNKKITVRITAPKITVHDEIGPGTHEIFSAGDATIVTEASAGKCADGKSF